MKKITKKPEKIEESTFDKVQDRRTFFLSISKAVLPGLALLGLGMITLSGCEKCDGCEATCADDCTHVCSEDCVGHCLGTCQNTCTEDCKEDCTGGCTSCTGTCYSGCEGDCEGDCSFGCITSCALGFWLS